MNQDWLDDGAFNSAASARWADACVYVAKSTRSGRKTAAVIEERVNTPESEIFTVYIWTALS